MALAAIDMQNCNKKKKCLSGVNEGLAYTPGSECDTGYIFNAGTCDCDTTINEECMLYKVSYTVNRSAYSVCAGNVSYTCNVVSDASREATVSCGRSVPYFLETGEGSWDFGGLTSFPACGAVPGYAASGTFKKLQLAADDINGNPAIVRSPLGSPLEIYSPVYAEKQSGGGCTVYEWEVYSDINIEPLCELNFSCITCSMDIDPTGTRCGGCPCPEGQYRDSLCDCVDSSIGTWQFDGIYTDSDGVTGIISQQFTIDEEDGYAFWAGDASVYWDGGTANNNEAWNAIPPWKSELVMTRTDVSCTGGNTTGMTLRKRSGIGSGGVTGLSGTDLQTRCNKAEGTPVSVSGSFTKIS